METYQVDFVVLTPLPYKYVVRAESEEEAQVEAVKKLQDDCFPLDTGLIQKYKVKPITGGPHS